MSKLCRLILLAATGFFTYGLVQLGIHFPPGVCLVAAGVAWRRLNGRRNSGSHGTATVATSAELAGGGLQAEGSRSLILGTTEYTPPPARSQAVRALLSPRVGSDRACRQFLSAWCGTGWGRDNLIRIDRFVHLMTVAPTRRGKGRSLLVPNLLSYEGSVVATDPKGELFDLTAAHREKAFGAAATGSTRSRCAASAERR